MAATTETSTPAKAGLKTARFDAKLPRAVASMLEASVPARGRKQTAVLEDAIEAFIARGPDPASMLRARVLADDGFMVTGHRERLFSFTARATPDQLVAIADAAAARSHLQDSVSTTDVAVAAIADHLAGSPAHSVLVHAEQLLAVCGVDLADLLNPRGRRLLDEDAPTG
jgi:hypothetical protein